MADYLPETARVTLLLNRRHALLNPAFGTNPGDGQSYIHDFPKYYLIRYNIDLPGEQTVYIEPYSEVEGTTYLGTSRDLPSLNFPPISHIQVMDGITIGDGVTAIL